MSFFGTLVGGGAALGVDIGTNSFKIAEIVSEGGVLTLKNYGILESLVYLERANQAIQTSTLKLSEDNAVNYLRLLLKRMRIGAHDVIASIPPFLTFSTLIEVPPMSDHEVQKFMELQGAQYIPMPISSVAIEWTKVGERRDEAGGVKHQLFIVAIPHEQLQKYKKMFTAVGLRLRAVEVEGMSVARALTHESAETRLIVDIGSRSTNLAIGSNGLLRFSSQTDFSGGSLTQVIVKALSISERRAEDLKRQRGLLGFGGSQELSTVIQPLIDVIINEAKRTVTAYETNYGDKVKQVFLAGGGANMAGLVEYWGKQMSVPVAKANPSSAVRFPEAVQPLIGDTGPLLTVAIGLGMKHFN